MQTEIANLLRQEIALLKRQNNILGRNTIFTTAGSIIAMFAFIIAIIALLK